MGSVVQQGKIGAEAKKKTVEVTAAAAGGGIAFVLAGALLSGSWFRRLP